MTSRKTKGTDDVLLILCNSVKNILKTTTASNITFSPVIQKTSKTCLKPDIGCFVVFDGGFSGLVVMNFSADAAMEIYRNYLTNMGMPEEELATIHTSDEVANSLGELMNQIVGNFQSELQNELRISVRQNQPKMLVLNQELLVAVNAKIDSPQFRKAAFETENHHPFYVEMAMEKTEFVELLPFEKNQTAGPDEIMEEVKRKGPGKTATPNGKADEDFMKELGL